MVLKGLAAAELRLIEKKLKKHHVFSLKLGARPINSCIKQNGDD
jgi:hypothetical protein